MAVCIYNAHYSALYNCGFGGGVGLLKSRLRTVSGLEGATTLKRVVSGSAWRERKAYYHEN